MRYQPFLHKLYTPLLTPENRKDGKVWKFVDTIFLQNAILSLKFSREKPEAAVNPSPTTGIII